MAASGSSSEHTCALSRVVLPKFKRPTDFERYSTSYWACRVCMRDSIKHQFLMSPKLAVHHEKSAYHGQNTKGAHYEIKFFSEEENTGWDGPSAVNDTFAWLRERELREYNSKKGEEWLKSSKWNEYNPDEDEFLHPGKSKSKPLKGRKGAKNAATAWKPKYPYHKRQDEDDADTVRVIRKDLGYWTYDPLPKPNVNVSKWTSGLSQASTEHEEHVPIIKWPKRSKNPAAESEEEDDQVVPIPVKVADNLLQFGQKFTAYARLNPKKSEMMHLFLELPTEEKVRRIELLAMRLSDPSGWTKVIDEPEFWN